MLRIGGEVVPEVLEIDPFAARDQLERRFTVEMEMPQISQQPNRLPFADARKKSVHQGNPFDFGWILCRVSVGNHQSDIVAHDLNTPVPERDGEGMNILRHRLLVVPAVRL